MKAKLVSMQELTRDNPTFCLSPLRVFDECHKCDTFKRHMDILRSGRKHTLTCKPHIKKDILDLLRRKEKLLEQLAIVNAILEG